MAILPAQIFGHLSLQIFDLTRLQMDIRSLDCKIWNNKYPKIDLWTSANISQYPDSLYLKASLRKPELENTTKLKISTFIIT